MMEENRIIAEFDGWVYVPTNENDLSNEHYEKGEAWCSVNSFIYHSDWNALMSVVEKIESLGYEVTIYNKSAIVWTNAKGIKNYYERTIGDTKLSAVYSACIKFINWYNENN